MSALQRLLRQQQFQDHDARKLGAVPTSPAPRSKLEGWLDPVRLAEKIRAEFGARVDDDGVLRLKVKA